MGRRVLVDMTGTRHGRLLGISYAHRGPSGHAHWRFLCDAGRWSRSTGAGCDRGTPRAADAAIANSARRGSSSTATAPPSATTAPIGPGSPSRTVATTRHRPATGATGRAASGSAPNGCGTTSASSPTWGVALPVRRSSASTLRATTRGTTASGAPRKRGPPAPSGDGRGGACSLRRTGRLRRASRQGRDHGPTLEPARPLAVLRWT